MLPIEWASKLQHATQEVATSRSMQKTVCLSTSLATNMQDSNLLLGICHFIAPKPITFTFNPCNPMCTKRIGLTHGSRLQAYVSLCGRELTFNEATPRGAETTLRRARDGRREAEMTLWGRFCHVDKFEVTSRGDPKLVYYKSSPPSILAGGPHDVDCFSLPNHTLQILSTATGRPNQVWTRH